MTNESFFIMKPVSSHLYLQKFTCSAFQEHTYSCRYFEKKLAFAGITLNKWVTPMISKWTGIMSLLMKKRQPQRQGCLGDKAPGSEVGLLISAPAVWLASDVHMGKVVWPLQPQCLPLQNGTNNSALLMRLLWGLSALMHAAFRAEYLVQSKPWINVKHPSLIGFYIYLSYVPDNTVNSMT